MTTSDVTKAVTALGDCCVETLDRDGLADAISTSATVRAWLDACDIRLARRARQLHDTGRSDAPGAMFGRAANTSTRQGENTARREQTATALPAFEHDLDRQRANSTIKRWIDKITGMHITKVGTRPGA